MKDSYPMEKTIGNDPEREEAAMIEVERFPSIISPSSSTNSAEVSWSTMTIYSVMEGGEDLQDTVADPSSQELPAQIQAETARTRILTAPLLESASKLTSATQSIPSSLTSKITLAAIHPGKVSSQGDRFDPESSWTRTTTPSAPVPTDRPNHQGEEDDNNDKDTHRHPKDRVPLEGGISKGVEEAVLSVSIIFAMLFLVSVVLVFLSFVRKQKRRSWPRDSPVHFQQATARGSDVGRN
ncbi:hypothetical protein IE53DRAFT_198706 [Violaceomyces palustris]|uniref:Uncharacterized protein n=1 Tax=Violaceomyces palustris TaxID=1673888 RepID=A0ACD0NRE1_9BASI|nr:hypothetical protein IE53DRAFT_198706 [Violaceomyces palustris]